MFFKELILSNDILLNYFFSSCPKSNFLICGVALCLSNSSLLSRVLSTLILLLCEVKNTPPIL